MYLIESLTGDRKNVAAVEPPPFGPGFDLKIAQEAVKLEVWGTSFNDSGPDHTEFRLLNSQGRVLARRSVAGY